MAFTNFDEPDVPTDLFECAIYLRDNVVGLATEGGSEPGYVIARRRLMADPPTKRLLPDFIRHSSNARSVRSALSAVASGSGSWAIRRGHVVSAFASVLQFLELGGAAADNTIMQGLAGYDAPAVQAMWDKALERRLSDPEGAVTAARTLLEEVCKHIIEDSNKVWNKDWTLPQLYTSTAKLMNLAPAQHQEEVFKTILGSCQNIVQSIGSLRNKGSDAHGGGRKRVRIQPRHAALTVNLAGSMALFMIETWQAQSDKEGDKQI